MVAPQWTRLYSKSAATKNRRVATVSDNGVSRRVAARPGWDAIPAVRDGQLFEVKSPIILQPGPAALTDGVAEIARIIREWSKEEGAE